MKVQLYTPHVNQLKIHNSINNDPYKYYVLNIGRQFGKSLLGVNQSLYWLFNHSKCQIAWASPTYKQAKKVFKDIDHAFSDSPQVFRDKNKTDLFLESHNKATLQFFSSENYDNNRGPTFDYVIIDEAAWQYEAAWQEVMRAWVLVKGKKVIFLSTPKGKNWFHNLHCLDGTNPQYKSFTMTSYDNPLILPSEIDDARLTLPENVFRQEYLAEFIDGGAGVFMAVPINETPQQDTKYFAGIDLGRADDYTVLTVINSKGESVYCERWRHDTWQNIVNHIVPILKHYQPKTLVEVNSIGDVIYEQIKKEYPNTHPFTTTSKSKQDIVEGLQVAIQNKEFTILKKEWLIKEFELFTYEYSAKTRSIKYSSPSGFHDDGVMSCCIAYKAMKDLSKLGRYHFA